ncbi:DUF309 domain-containing protein [Alkalicoccobacillus porphyridii]|uniref:DUF309 domain-containing protein n=1 Tax=Alkalicoccobacillus porphyridii TaxID=2597270 RepID=A0A553ZZI9_9BACI|nr:DUF309 domain-containing protein [Alkalicoccobacillus porphyridii]TSB46845.1 DUF309 domain-containing protein [Alkalicoccobacillus porphyridii]
MTYPAAYIDYLIYFHAERDYFECHEILEEHWKTTSRGSANSHWVALIQIAVALYHERRGNIKGAERMLTNARRLISAHPAPIQKLGLHSEELILLLDERYKRLSSESEFVDLNLPIKDSALLELCLNKSQQLRVTWCSPSVLSNTQLIHKHTLRDRQPVIDERANQLKRRQNNKEKK